MRRKIIYGLCIVLALLILVPCGWVAGVYFSYGNLDANTLISALVGSDSITKHSKDGEYYLTTEVWRRTDGRKDAYLCVLLNIHDRSGRLLQVVNTRASDVHRWDVQWKDNHAILMTSSDIGDYVYARNEAGIWARLSGDFAGEGE